MGQQQLLLVILVTIIVGIATVVAINTFSSSADAANQDAVRQDLASIAASAQGYYMKPKMLGGGGNSFEDLTFKGISVPGTVSSDGLEIENQNGVYKIAAAGAANAQTFVVTAYASSDNKTGNKDATATFTGTIEPNEINIAPASND